MLLSGSGPHLVALRNMFCTSGFVDDIMFARNGQQ